MTKVEPRHVFRSRDEFDFADFGMVFGNDDQDTLANRVSHAVDLYRQKALGRLLLTGGAPKRSAADLEPEAERMKKIALQSGVRKEDLLIESKSSDTIGNFLYSVQILDRCLQGQHFSSIALISCPSHMGRVWMLAQRHLGKRAKLFCSHTDHEITWATWESHRGGRHAVRKEMRYIQKLLQGRPPYDLPEPNVA